MAGGVRTHSFVCSQIFFQECQISPLVNNFGSKNIKLYTFTLTQISSFLEEKIKRKSFKASHTSAFGFLPLLLHHCPSPPHPTPPNPSYSLTFWFSTCDLPPPFVSWSTPSLHQRYHLTQLPTVIPNVGMMGFNGYRLLIEDRWIKSNNQICINNEVWMTVGTQ